MKVYPVILCGGSGTRLWPASRPDRPKQFIPLVGERSSFQQTLLRVIGIHGAGQPIVISGARHATVVQAQLKALGVDATLLLEPEARDSGPAIAAAAAWIAARDSDSLAVVVSSDHYVPDEAAFQAAANRALSVAEQGWIVTLGVRPTEPSTAFGYIKPGLRVLADGLAHDVAAFVEKPDRETAARYIAEGYLWNSGNFVAAAATLLAEFDRYAPAVGAAARAAVSGAVAENGSLRLSPAFGGAPKISIDYAVMEKTERAAVATADFAWSDLGAWDTVKAVSPADAAGNSVTGEAVLIDTANALVRTHDGVRVGLVGVSGLAVIVEPDAVLVTSLAASQQIKELAARMGETPPPATVATPAAPGHAPRQRTTDKRWTVAARLVLLTCAVVTALYAFAPPGSGAHLFPWDKADHFCSFFAIMTAAVVAFPRAPVLWIAVVISAMGGAIELIQGLPMVGRDCDVWDWITENVAIGAVIGLLVAGELRRRLRAHARAEP